MRTVEKWQAKILPKLLKTLTPRLQKDLQQIPWPKDLPEHTESLYLFGEKGTGKTVRAAFVYLQEYKWLYLNQEEGKEVVFLSTPDLFYRLKEAMNNKETTEADIVEIYRHVHLLILDDFGTIKPSDWVLQILYLIINYRYEMLLPTVFTSNLDLDEVAKVLGDERITSRIERMSKVMEKKHWKK
jgi:DNA replication protein DnaC